MADKTDFEKKKERHASGESTMSTDSVTNYIPTPPDGGYGWVIVFASFLNHVIVDGIAFTFGIFYMAFLDYFKESSNRTALVGSILAGCYLLSGAVASAMVNKFGCRIVCVFGSLLATSGFLLSTLSPSIGILYITYGVMGGCGLGFIYLPSVISVSYYFQRRRAIATGIAVCGAGVGCFIFAPAGRLLLETYDWKSAMMFVAGITLNASVCGMLMRPLENPRKKRPRKKNVLDRLMEQARNKIGRNRNDSEGETCAYSTSEANNEIMQKVQEVKLARLKMLGEEDGDSVLSFPNSVMNSARRLDDSRLNSRANSIVTRDTSRQGSLGVETVSPGSTLPRICLEDAELKETSDEDVAGEKPVDICVPQTPEQETVPLQSEKPACINGFRKDSRETQRKNPHFANGHVQFADGHANGFGSLNVVANGKQNGMTDTRRNVFPENGLDHGKKANSTMEVKDFFLQIPRKRNVKPAGVHKDDYSRPMYRKDIFYSGSIIHINHFRSQPNIRSYMRSVTSIPAAVPPEKESKIWRCLHVPKEAKDTLKDMLDITLFLDPVFLIACLGNAFGFIGLFVPFIFMPQRAMSLGIDDSRAAFLLSVIGITNTIGRVLAGWLADRDGVNPLLLHNLAIVCGGIACILNMFATNYAGMCVFAAFFGLCVAAWISLTSIILCNLLGLQKLTNAFGLLTMTRGMASIAGPPFAGFMYDATANYDAAFHLGGAVLTVSGLIFCLLHLPYFQRYNAERDLDLDLQEQTIADIPDDILLDNESSDNMDHIDLEKENEVDGLIEEGPKGDKPPNGHCPV